MKNTKAICSLLFCFIFLISCKNEVKEEEQLLEDSSLPEENLSKKEADISGDYTLDIENSKIAWVGFKPAGTHNGEIKIKSGKFNIENTTIVGGKFVADMSSISVLDLEGDERKDLEQHLKGTNQGEEDHFFNVKKYPTAKFEINSVEKSGKKYLVNGALTIKGVTNDIEFLANYSFGEDPNTMKFISDEFGIDRTKWNVKYMSKSVFDDLKERFIDDEIKLKVAFKAIKS